MGRDGRGVKAKSASSIEITFQYKGERCREPIPLPPTSANLKRVTEFRAKLLYEIHCGTFDYAQVFPNSPRAAKFAEVRGDVLLVKDFLETWFKSKSKELAASSRRDWDATVFKRLIPAFGAMPLSKLTRREIKAWLEKIDDGREKMISNGRLLSIQTVLRVALTAAVDDDLIDFNPLANYSYTRNLPVDPDAEDPVDPFSKEEQAAILAACDEPQLRNQIQFALWTGLRTSELVGLNWPDIDFTRGFVRVRRAITREAKGVAETPKTIAGRRDVKLLPPALAALEAQRQYTALADGPVFVNPDTGKRWDGSQPIYHRWRRIIRRARVMYRKPYQTRHTYASMMLSAGEHPMWVAKQMGHADWTMIARVYGRWMPDAESGAGGKAVAMFSDAPATAAAQRVA
ncbi:Arm DNA-binding domain-containing protein [Burkholderia sp. Bp8990]|uniref:Arm DNA-binding domain-containing protein n=1 Tax=Burkholderia sp. Bp8990 TaxID=2184552 RepID=UPI000F5A747A|nr:DUF3596 domain-containing protein [Burkholderia sp. Bp8990]RQS39803.1 DUF3596 domain-containing protein [Burkholderia sp. Bp8990]